MRSNSFHLFRLQIGSITESSSRVREVITGVELLSTFDYAVACVQRGIKVRVIAKGASQVLARLPRSFMRG